MKTTPSKKNKKNQKVVKGMPSAVLLSILIHGALFLLAGMLVVFTVVKNTAKRIYGSPWWTNLASRCREQRCMWS